VHALKHYNLPHNLPPNEGIEFEDDWPWFHYTYPDGLSPARQSFFAPVLRHTVLKLPSALRQPGKLLFTDEEWMSPLIIQKLQVILIVLCKWPAPWLKASAIFSMLSTAASALPRRSIPGCFRDAQRFLKDMHYTFLHYPLHAQHHKSLRSLHSLRGASFRAN
jgi:hypothetical protein